MMKHAAKDIQILNTVTEYTRFYQLPAPAHPLLTLVDLSTTREAAAIRPKVVIPPVVPQLYTIFLKRNLKGLLYYGHQSYDFSEGVLGFSAPGQVFTISEDLDWSEVSGWMLIFHPDLLAKYPLGGKMADYSFFSYDVHEALHLSAQEENTLDTLLQAIQSEYERPIDAFSQAIVVSQLEVLLNYANRFYNRQFLTRRMAEHDYAGGDTALGDAASRPLLSRFETRLTAYFAQNGEKPLPTVQYFADELRVSPAYLSDMLRSLTGQTTQQHIHHALIEKAKQLLLTTSLSINETAYQLGFEYPQYFSRLFKNKTGLSPAAFRVLMP